MVYSSGLFFLSAIVLWRAGLGTDAMLALCLCATSSTYHHGHGKLARAIDILTVRGVLAYCVLRKACRGGTLALLLVSCAILECAFHSQVGKKVIPMHAHLTMHIMASAMLCGPLLGT